VTAPQDAPPGGVADQLDVADAPEVKPDRRAREDPKERAIGIVQRSGAAVMLAVTLIIGAVSFGESFTQPDNLIRTIAAGSAFLAIVAVGMTFVIISGGIDLSVGSVLAMSAVLTAYCSTEYGLFAALTVPLIASALIGLVHGLLITRLGLPPFIVTLAGLQFARGVAFKVTKEGNETALIEQDSPLRDLGRKEIIGVPLPVLIALAAFVIGAIVLNRTRFGQSVFAIGGSEDAASLMGLPVRRIKVSLYVWSSLLAGLAGMLIAARSSTGEPTAGYGLELQAIAAVVIGGTLLTGGYGTMSGTLAGVALLAVVQNLINQVGTLSQYYQDVVSGAFLLTVVLLQTVLGRRRRL
jgi:ribose transport system permease protein